MFICRPANADGHETQPVSGGGMQGMKSLAGEVQEGAAPSCFRQFRFISQPLISLTPRNFS